MQTDVVLQDPFHYWIIPIIGGLVLLLGVVAWFGFRYRKRKPKIPAPVPVQVPIQQPVMQNRDMIVNRYFAMLQEIEEQLDSGAIDLRIAYQKLSTCLRSYVTEVSGVNLIHMTLFDIQANGLPKELEELVAEYYEPEFAEKSVGNIKQSINKTKQVMGQWN